jgi:murein DD-endopeptidase MepM/ murein hydrolase activator NlpD
MLIVVAALSLLSVLSPGRAVASGTWTWPVVGPVVRGFDPPASPYGSGHRGIDIGAPDGTPVAAPAPGVVTFAGNVAGRLYVTIDHGGGLLSTASFLSNVSVRKGDLVAEGQVVALSGTGHVGDASPDLHFGIRLNGAYVDPLDYLGPANVSDLIRLAPILSFG